MQLMHNRMKVRSLFLFLMLVLSLLLAACSGSSGASTGEFNVQVMAAPEGRNGTYLTVVVSDKAGNPVTDAKVGVEGNMTHPGMAPVIADAVTDEADGKADGSYQIPFAFNMAGDWVITVLVDRNGNVESYDVPASVNETEVTIQ